MTFCLNNRLLKQRTVLTRPPRRIKTRRTKGKAAGENQPEACPCHPPTLSSQSRSFPMGHVEDCFDLRTPLEGCYSSRQVVTC